MRRSIMPLLLCLALTGCAPGGAETLEHAAPAMTYCLTAALYYPDMDGGVTRVERTFPWEYEMEAGVLDALKAAPEDGLLPALPEGAAYTARVTEAEATVDLCGLPPFSDAETEKKTVQCVVNTLLSLPYVDSVRLTFEGERVSALKNGTPVYEPFTEQLP